MDYIRAIERQQIREDIPEVRVGDNVKVHYRIVEGDRTREQVFQGDIIRLSGEGSFPLHSPKIAKLEVLRHGVVHRAKLYFLRDRVGKAARLREKR